MSLRRPLVLTAPTMLLALFLALLWPVATATFARAGGPDATGAGLESLVDATAPAEERGVASTQDRAVVLDRGHIDLFEVTYDRASARPVLSVKDDTRLYAAGPVFRDPREVSVVVDDERARQVLPAATDAWGFLGSHGGAHVHLLTQSGDAQDGLPWPGWSTERLLGSLDGTGVALAAGGQPVRLDLTVDGPGEVFAWQNDAFGGPINVVVNTTAGPGGSIPVAANAHVHTNWAFTAEGDYALTVTPSIQTQGAGTVTGDPVVYHVRVGAREGEPGAVVRPPVPGPVQVAPPAASPDPAPTADPASDATPDPAPADEPERCEAVAVQSTTRAADVSVATEGHLDLGAHISGSTLSPRVKDDRSPPTQWRDPRGLVVHVSDAGRRTVPSDPAYSFLGAAGTDVWMIGQVQEPGVPWLGWNTQHDSVLSQVSGGVVLTLASVEGPGRLAVYSTGTFGGVGARLFGTAEGFPTAHTVPVNTHEHANWAFTAPGVYRVTLTQSATLTGGASVSGTAVLSFVVGSGDPMQAAPTVTSTEYVGRTASGADCELTAEQRGELALSGVTGVPTAAVVAAGSVLAGVSLLVARTRGRNRGRVAEGPGGPRGRPGSRLG